MSITRGGVALAAGVHQVGTQASMLAAADKADLLPPCAGRILGDGRGRGQTTIKSPY